MIAEVITPDMLAPKASPRMIALGLSLLTIFCATFAVVGTQLTAAIPITGLKFPRLIMYMIYPPRIPPIPDRRRAVIPSSNSFSTFGSSRSFASHKTPSNSPSMNVDPYNNGPLTKSIICFIPDSRIATPRNNEKNNGDATGNKKHKTAHRITEKASFTDGL